MKYFGANIRIEGDSLAALFINVLGWEAEKQALAEADKYENQILGLLNRISQTQTGRVLLQALGKLSHKTMVIKPEIDQSPVGKTNAFAEAENLHDARKKGKPVLLPLGNTVLNVGEGTGLGSNTTIYLTPNQWADDKLSKDMKDLLGFDSYPGIWADDILVHEMVHGLRQMAGVNYQKGVPLQKKKIGGERVNCYPNIEEWFAVLIQNIYRSECGRNLRIDYGTTLGEFSDKEFVRRGMNRAHLRQLRREHGEFFTNLRNINAPFNPTRLLLDF